MPWLVGTALIHSLAVTEKRGGFKMWTALLAILAFSLSLLGTFIVRSGVLSSVHAFATDPARGLFILGFLAVVIGGSLLLFAWRAPKVGTGGAFDLVSREAMLLANNVLLLVAAAAVLLGTLYPLVLDALGMGKISVGPPYFDSVFVPLLAPALFLMGIGPIAKWRSAQVGDLARRLRWALAVSAVSAVIAPFALGHWTPMIGFGLLLGVWVASTVLVMLGQKLREQPPARWRAWLAQQPGSWYGMLLAHFGVAVFVVGVTVVNGFQVEKDLRMAPGESTEIAGLRVRFDGVREVRGPNYVASRGTLELTRGTRVLAVLHPERRNYLVTGMPMTETAIDRRFTRDLYVSLGDPLDGGAWSVRVYYKPLVGWIWGGCLLMALGGALAVIDRRYRATRRAAAPNPRPDTLSGQAAAP
jgi:cytochrome c-type biogenesis protein CcmF